MSVSVYKMVVEVFDFENYDQEDVIQSIEENKYHMVKVKDCKKVVIKDWTDNHPLNKHDTSDAEFKRLFDGL